MFLALLAGCGLGLHFDADDTDAVVIEDPGSVAWTIEPASLDLGTTSTGEPITAGLTLTNTGDMDLLVLDLDEDREDHLEVTLSDVPLLNPGASTQLNVVWTPSEPGAMSTALAITVGGSPEDPELLSVPVAGIAQGATPTVSTTSYDFGEIGISCQDELMLTLTNTGNVAMQVDEVTLRGAEGFTLDDPDDLPWVLNPYQSHEQIVRFEPEDLGPMFGELVFETDQGEVTTELQGEGVVDEERTITFDVAEQSRSTMIVNVNLTAIPNSTEDQYSTFFVAALPTFFQTLLDNHTKFRAGFVWSVTGTVDGDYDYIDESFTASEATDIALDMIAPGANGGDNDANFRTIQNAIGANSDWLFEDASWAESRLCLFTIQRDTEASGGSWSNWVAQAQAFKDDPDDIVYHAIAGPVPGGCGSAEAFMDYDKAITETGGMLLSVCASDWTDHMAKIATACIDGAAGVFQLEGNPMVSSIEVSVDSERLTEGWSYDDSLNAVVFDECAYPDYSSVVTIHYWMSQSCG
jgi:hypothetical protein